MKNPIPIRWKCGQCGAEMAFTDYKQLQKSPIIYCSSVFCPQSKIPISIEDLK